MPKLSGIFDDFPELDNVILSEVNKWLKIKLKESTLKNYIANRIYYPQTIPLSKQEMEIDLAILKAALKFHSQKYYNSAQNRLTIPEKFTHRFYPLVSLIAAFIDGINLAQVTEIVIQKREGASLVGSIYLALDILDKNPSVEISSKEYKLKLNTLTLIPFDGGSTKLKIGNAKEVVVSGGSVGIFIDLRKRR